MLGWQQQQGKKVVKLGMELALTSWSETQSQTFAQITSGWGFFVGFLRRRDRSQAKNQTSPEIKCVCDLDSSLSFAVTADVLNDLLMLSTRSTYV